MFKKPARPSKYRKKKQNEGAVNTKGSEKVHETKEGHGEPSKHPSSENLSKIPELDEKLEKCYYDKKCKREFKSYYSMMRHVAFSHKTEGTAELMNLKLKKIEC